MLYHDDETVVRLNREPGPTMSNYTNQPATPIGGAGTPQPPTISDAIPIGGAGAPTPPTTAPAQPIGGLAAQAPIITTHPQSKSIVEGQATTLNIVAQGTPPLAYQWYFNDVATVDDATLGGSQTNSIYFNPIQSGRTGRYKCTVTNGSGTATSFDAILTVTASAGVPPNIAMQPQSKTVSVGNSASFSCLANGSSPFTYKWYRNDVEIVGANASNFVINNVQPADAADYHCIITNPYGSATSNKAKLTTTTAGGSGSPIYLGNGGIPLLTVYTQNQLKTLAQGPPQINPVLRSTILGTYEISAPPSGQNEYRVMAFPAVEVAANGSIKFESSGATLPMQQITDTTVDGIVYNVFRTTARSVGDFTLIGGTAINVSN